MAQITVQPTATIQYVRLYLPPESSFTGPVCEDAGTDCCEEGTATSSIGTSTGSGVEYVTVNCCENPIPKTLTGTVSNKNAPCTGLPTTITAHWDAGTQDWRTGQNQTGCYAYAGVGCSFNTWSGGIGSDGGPSVTLLISVSCDPFEIVIDYYTTAPGDGFRVTWTE